MVVLLSCEHCQACIARDLSLGSHFSYLTIQMQSHLVSSKPHCIGREARAMKQLDVLMTGTAREVSAQARPWGKTDHSWTSDLSLSLMLELIAHCKQSCSGKGHPPAWCVSHQALQQSLWQPRTCTLCASWPCPRLPDQCPCCIAPEHDVALLS